MKINYHLATITIIVSLIISPTASAVMLDLSFDGASGFINGALFAESDTFHPAGTDHRVFLRIGDNQDVVDGYNTDARPIQAGFETKDDPHTHSLLLSDVAVVTIDNIDYREFILDINQNSGKNSSLLSLDELEIYLAASPTLGSYPSLGTKIYEMDPAGFDNWIKLDYDLNSGGSGWGDMNAFIPNALFNVPNNTYVYLYSRFGENYANNDGFEEWAAVKGRLQVPVPATLWLLGVGLAGLALRVRKTS